MCSCHEIVLRSEAHGTPPQRRKELDYYTVNCRSVGNQAALVAGFAYSGIRYHYLLEHQAGWHLSQQNSVEEVIFLTLLTLSMGCGLQARRLYRLILCAHCTTILSVSRASGARLWFFP